MAVAPTSLLVLMGIVLLFVACGDKHRKETKEKQIDIAIDDSLRSRLAAFAQDRLSLIHTYFTGKVSRFFCYNESFI